MVFTDPNACSQFSKTCPKLILECTKKRPTIPLKLDPKQLKTNMRNMLAKIIQKYCQKRPKMITFSMRVLLQNPPLEPKVV